MSTLELKKQLIDKIESLDNDMILEELYRILDIGEEDFSEYKLSDIQRDRVSEGIEEIEAGKVTSHEIAKKEIDEWLLK